MTGCNALAANTVGGVTSTPAGGPTGGVTLAAEATESAAKGCTGCAGCVASGAALAAGATGGVAGAAAGSPACGAALAAKATEGATAGGAGGVACPAGGAALPPAAGSAAAEEATEGFRGRAFFATGSAGGSQHFCELAVCLFDFPAEGGFSASAAFFPALPFFFFRMNRCSRTDTAMLAICLANVSAKPLAKTGVARGRGMGSQPPLDATETVETWRPNVRPRGEPADPAPCSSGSLPQMAAPSEVACSTSPGGVPLTVGRL